MQLAQDSRKCANSVLWTFFGIFVVLRILLLFRHHDVRWDEAVFLSMGKFFVTTGAIGFWEAIRPPLLPVLLGILDLVGNPVILGEIAIGILSIVGVYVFFLLIRESMDHRIAAAASGMLLFADVWFWYSGMLFTGVPSAVFMLLSLYAFHRNRFVVAGFLSAVAFLIRFPAGLAFGSMFLLLSFAVIKHRKAQRVKARNNWLELVAGFLSPVLIWLLINSIVFRSKGVIAPVYPLLAGSSNVFAMNTWLHNTELSYYFVQLWQFSPLWMLAIPGAYLACSHKPLRPLAVQTLLAFVFFLILPNNQWRFAILFLPGIIMFVGLAADFLAKKSTIHTASSIAFVILLSLSTVFVVQAVSSIENRPAGPLPDELAFRYFELHPVDGTLIVSHPVAGYFADNKIIPIYYEYFDRWDSALADPDIKGVLYTRYSFPCQDTDDVCIEAVDDVEQRLMEEFTLEQTFPGDITYYAYTRPTSS